MKYKDDWLTTRTIKEREEDINVDSLVCHACHMRKEKDISYFYRADEKGNVSFNVGYLKYNWERRRKIQFQCQDMYFKIIEMMPEPKLKHKFADYLGTYYQKADTFMKVELFTNTYFISLSSLKISKRLIEFNNFCNELLTDMHFDNVNEEYDYYEITKMKKETK